MARKQSKDPGISFVWELHVLDSCKNKGQRGHCGCGKCEWGKLTRREASALSNPHVQFIIDQHWPLTCLGFFWIFSLIVLPYRCSSWIFSIWIESIFLPFYWDNIFFKNLLYKQDSYSTHLVRFSHLFFISPNLLPPLELCTIT